MSDVLLKNITKCHGDFTVIDNLTLDIRAGEFVTLLGPSGCGKTTLLRMIAGLEPIDGGDLIIGGKRFNGVSPQRRRIAMVFQSYALFPHMNVRENILFGLKIRKMTAHDMFDKLSWVLSLLDLEGLEHRLPRQISGGQRQRVALGRALVLDPDVLLLDEPLSNLDTALRELAMEELKRVHRQVGKTIVYVTHNQAEAMTMSERIAILNAGRIEQYASPREVYDEPATLFAAEFIGSPAMNILNGEIADQDQRLGVTTPVGFFLLDRDRAFRAGAMVGKRVKVGIRPQHIHFAAHGTARRASDTFVNLTVELVESLGDRSLVVARSIDNSEVVVRFLVAREEDIRLDTAVEAYVDGRRIHVFDPVSGKNLLLAPLTPARERS